MPTTAAPVSFPRSTVSRERLRTPCPRADFGISCGVPLQMHCLRATGVFTVFLLLACTTLPIHAKVIRLRNENIIPKNSPAVAAQAKLSSVQSAGSGLFLVQLNGPPSPRMRVELAAVGVDLLRYVPADAFVARLQDANLSSIRGLPFVVGSGNTGRSTKFTARCRLRPRPKPPGKPRR